MGILRYCVRLLQASGINITQCFLIGAFLLMAASIHGDWMLLAIFILKFTNYESVEELTADCQPPSLGLFNNWQMFWISSIIPGFVIYFSVGGFIHWYYYVRQRSTPEAWKCQPKKFISAKLEMDEILEGTFSLIVTSTVSSLLACYIYNGGYTTLYYRWDQHGIWYWLLHWPIVFVYQDYTTYWIHRTFHHPWLYSRFHSTHHRYKQPTAFSATAIHPVEITTIQLFLILPLFVIPVHCVTFYVIALYTYYHGIISHSGVNFKSHWWQPWQPDTIFHDYHHLYVNVNYGFNIWLWDYLHGTYKSTNRKLKNHQETLSNGEPSKNTEEEANEGSIAELKNEPETYSNGEPIDNTDQEAIDQGSFVEHFLNSSFVKNLFRLKREN